MTTQELPGLSTFLHCQYDLPLLSCFAYPLQSSASSAKVLRIHCAEGQNPFRLHRSVRFTLH